MAEYIDREAFVAEKRKQYCEDCDKRKGMKRGKLQIIYEIGSAPCLSCGVDDMFGDIEDYPAADVAPVVRCKDCGSWSANIPDDGWGWCFNSAIGEGERNADFYCAYGAKMEETE